MFGSFRLYCFYFSVFILITISETAFSQVLPSFDNEAWNKADPDYIESKKFKSISNENIFSNGKKMRFIYLVPQDRAVRDDYKAAIADVALHLQDFYQKELGNENAFTLNQPIVEVYQTSHTASWYKTNPPRQVPPQPAYSSYFWENALNDGFALTGGGFNDPNNRWIYYIDAETDCGQFIGGNAGIALMSSNDLRGLTGQSNLPACSGQSPDTSGKYRWIGGAGHEIAHSFNVPHPPGCGSSTGCQGGTTDANSIMWSGYALYPQTYFLSQDKQTLLNTGFFTPLNLKPSKFADYENDQKADISVWRPNNSIWYIIQSSSSSIMSPQWGDSTDVLVPGDYDGDRKTDTAVWRPNSGTWLVIRSSDNTFFSQQFGMNGDIPVASDYDGDRLTDVAVWRPSNGNWYIRRSATNTLQVLLFGQNGDKPVAADYDGDKRTDIAVFRPSANAWYIHRNYLSYYYYTSPPNSSQITYTTTQFGDVNDKLVPADYDGDKQADIAVWRPSNATWYYLKSGSNNQFQDVFFGQNNDIPSPADYDGDGKIDFAVWSPANGNWYILKSSTNTTQITQWGQSGDIPTPAAFVR